MTRPRRDPGTPGTPGTLGHHETTGYPMPLRRARSPIRHTWWSLAATFAVAGAAVSCAADTSDLSLSPRAQEGQDLYRSSGCASCHGGAGQGGVGPVLAGVSGTERELIDGSIVVADRAYLVRAIMDPAAEIVAGYSLRMPTNQLTADEVDAIIAFIDELEPSS